MCVVAYIKNPLGNRHTAAVQGNSRENLPRRLTQAGGYAESCSSSEMFERAAEQIWDALTAMKPFGNNERRAYTNTALISDRKSNVLRRISHKRERKVFSKLKLKATCGLYTHF